jgi:hypothetical protein
MGYIRKTEPQHEPGEVIEMMVRSTADPSEMGQPSTSTDEAHWMEMREETRRKPIISINGEDIDDEELDRAA